MTISCTKKLSFLFLFFCLCGLTSFETHSQTNGKQELIKIACIGNSITYGTGVVNRDKNAYPRQLQGMLDENKYEVKNFGVSGATLLKKGGEPYWATSTFQKAITYKPDIVLIKLGTNDSKLPNRKHLGEFKNDYKDLLSKFKAQNPNARIVLLLPLPSFEQDSTQIWNPVLEKQIIPMIKEVAYETESEILDLHRLFVDQEALMPDKLHPSSLGATVIARRIFELVQFDSGDNFDLIDRIGVKNFQEQNFHGFQQFDIVLNGLDCKIVKPKQVNNERRWVWRARFWGHEPQTDIALLERGFHLVYCDVSGLFGSPEAVERWNQFYKILVSAGLHPKAVLEGMSRGGLIIYNWAIANPEKVACVYADAPVLDGKSWPGGLGECKGSKTDWDKFKNVYQINSEEDLDSFNGNPLQQADAIVRAGFPILHVCGEADKVVPVNENSRPFEKKIIENGGDIQVIYKEGVGHHPHSLKNPTVIVDFILRASDSKINFAAIPSPGSEYRAAAGWKKGKGWWYQKEEIDSLCRSTENADLILIGNSITQGWGGRRLVTHAPGSKAARKHLKDLKWINAGISGDRTEHVAFRIREGAYQKCKPEFIVLTIGVNNFSYNAAYEIVLGIKKDLELIQKKFPEAKVILIGPLPTGIEKDSDRRKKYDQIHKSLAAINDFKDVHYFNLINHFLDGQGNLDLTLYGNDGIHLHPAGYMIWAQFLETTISKLKS